MFATYTLSKNELNEVFLHNLKNFGNSDKLMISIEDYDETEYLMKSAANRDFLLKGIKNVEEGRNLISINIQEIEKLIDETNNI
jgi:hypothetical protein